MKKHLLFLLILPLLIASCKKNDDSSQPEINATVQGAVYMDGSALQNVNLILNNNFKLSARTDQNGRFAIYTVPNGSYSLNLSSYLSNGSSIFQTIGFNVQNANVDLGLIRLSKPMTIISLDTVSSNTLTIKWSKVADAAFTYYSIYKKSTPDIDETTGEFLYKTMNPSDTSFTDNSYVKGQGKYYRVFAHTSLNRIYASTIEGINTPPKDFISNGSFESSQRGILPDNWTYDNQGVNGFSYMKLSSSEFKEGRKSLEIYWVDTIANYSHKATLYQRIQASNLVPGRTYKFSFWAKSSKEEIGASLFLEDQPNYLSVQSGQDWTYKEFTFLMKEEIKNIRIEINSTGRPKTVVDGWIDNMTLIEVKP